MCDFDIALIHEHPPQPNLKHRRQTSTNRVSVLLTSRACSAHDQLLSVVGRQSSRPSIQTSQTSPVQSAPPRYVLGEPLAFSLSLASALSLSSSVQHVHQRQTRRHSPRLRLQIATHRPRQAQPGARASSACCRRPALRPSSTHTEHGPHITPIAFARRPRDGWIFELLGRRGSASTSYCRRDGSLGRLPEHGS